ncbi:MAG TPA: 5-oxoprolinase subunit PxpA [Gemmatimonadaceae bacterium]|nr:5-oxoprolinase subunit PxpA [Gemmatimonadaceae bacterium]
MSKPSPSPSSGRSARSRIGRVERTIDLNADVGEGSGDSRRGADASLLDLVSSASIACGFHAGDARTMRDTVCAARDRSVAIGAHPSYPDLPGFGRRELGTSPDHIRWAVHSQIDALANVCAQAGARLSYAKPHGALYNRATVDRDAAAAIVEAVTAFDPALCLLCPADSELATAAARAGLAHVAEAFADRAYQSDGRLVSRERAGGVLSDPESAADRALALVLRGTIETIEGRSLRLEAQSICVHGDGDTALPMLRILRRRLEEAGIAIERFA